MHRFRPCGSRPYGLRTNQLGLRLSHTAEDAVTLMRDRHAPPVADDVLVDLELDCLPSSRLSFSFQSLRPLQDSVLSTSRSFARAAGPAPTPTSRSRSSLPCAFARSFHAEHGWSPCAHEPGHVPRSVLRTKIAAAIRIDLIPLAEARQALLTAGCRGAQSLGGSAPRTAVVRTRPSR